MFIFLPSGIVLERYFKKDVKLTSKILHVLRLKYKKLVNSFQKYQKKCKFFITKTIEYCLNITEVNI